MSHIIPFDKCIANNEINRSPCTIIRDLGGLKISCKNLEVMTNMPIKLDNIYRKDTTAIIMCLNRHENLRMRLDFSAEGNLIIDMCVKKILSGLPEELDGNSSPQIPATNHLLTINQDPGYWTLRGSIFSITLWPDYFSYVSRREVTFRWQWPS